MFDELVSTQVPLLSSEDGACQSTIVPLPDFCFHKHMPAVIDRLRTEIDGATFTSKVLRGKKRKAAESEGEEAEKPVIAAEILAPKKRAKKAAKRKAAPKSASENQEQEDAVMADVAQEGGCSRKRWWIDDVLACLIFAAGAIVSALQKQQVRVTSNELKNKTN